MRGRILWAVLLGALLVPATGARASEGSQARAVGAALRPFAAALPDVDAVAAGVVGDAGDATVARCGGAASAIAGFPAARRKKLVAGIGLLQLGLDVLPATTQVLLTPLQATQDELQDLVLRSPVLRSARAARRRALKALSVIAGQRGSLCEVLAPWAADGFTTDREAPSYRRIRRASRRAAATLDAFKAAFDGGRDPARKAGAAALAAVRASRRVQAALTLQLALPATNAAFGADPVARALRRADRAAANGS